MLKLLALSSSQPQYDNEIASAPFMFSMRKHESGMQSLIERAFKLAPECRS